MKALSATAIVAVLVLFGETASAGGRPGPPLTLTALADIGTVLWRYDCTPRQSSWSLGIRLARQTATTVVTFQSQKLTLQSQLEPGQTRWFPFRRSRVQTLRATQGTEPGTLRAIVTVNFGYRHGVAHCYPYTPPRFTVQQYPR